MRLDWHLPAIARIFPILHDHPAAQSYIGLAAAITGAVFLDFALELFIDLFLLPMVIWDLASRGRVPVTLWRTGADCCSATPDDARRDPRVARFCRLGGEPAPPLIT